MFSLLHFKAHSLFPFTDIWRQTSGSAWRPLVRFHFHFTRQTGLGHRNTDTDCSHGTSTTRTWTPTWTRTPTRRCDPGHRYGHGRDNNFATIYQFPDLAPVLATPDDFSSECHGPPYNLPSNITCLDSDVEFLLSDAAVAIRVSYGHGPGRGPGKARAWARSRPCTRAQTQKRTRTRTLTRTRIRTRLVDNITASKFLCRPSHRRLPSVVWHLCAGRGQRGRRLLPALHFSGSHVSESGMHIIANKTQTTMLTVSFTV